MNTEKMYAEQIAQEYALKKERKVIALKKLDRYAKRPAVAFSYVFGIVNAILQSVGTVLQAISLINGNIAQTVIGMVLTVIGIVGMAINPPLYKRLAEKCRDKYREDVLELSRKIIEDEY